MCSNVKDFTLCSCVEKNEPTIHNKKSRRNKKLQPKIKFKWTIKRYLSTPEKDFIAMGSIAMPRNYLNSWLTNDRVLSKLNNANCFDFDFIPEEKDTLNISQDDNWFNYLSFTYQRGKWIEGIGYDAFDDEIEIIKKGKLKELEN
ncbi:MAG: hypothetical protein ACPGVD_01680 [Flavobacteriales bacterium]